MLERSSISAAMRHPLVRAGVIALVLALCYLRWAPSIVRLPAIALLSLAWMRIETGGFARIGLAWPVDARATLRWALLITLIITVLITPVIEPWLTRLSGEEVDYSGYGPLLGNLSLALGLLGKAMLSAVIAEEVIFRGFLLHQLQALLGTARWVAPLVVVLGAVAFGVAHSAQGAVGMIVTGLAGAVAGAVYLASGRNLWATMLAHALVDIWGVGTLYYGWY